MSEDRNILTVDENGLVTGVKQGSCKITAYSTEYSNLKCSVYIQSGYSDRLNVKCEHSTYMLKPGETLQLYTTKYNEEQGVTEPYNDVTYSVRLYNDREQAATVDENGLLTAIAEGFAFVEIVDNNDFKMTDCRIEIKNEITVESLVIINNGLFNFYLDHFIETDKGQLQLKTVSMPGNRLYENVTYSVDDESIATIDAETGLLTAIRDGEVEVTATSKTDDSLKANAYAYISNQSTGGVTEDTSGTTYTKEDLYNSMQVSFLNDDGQPASALDGQSYYINIALDADIESQFNVERAYITVQDSSGDMIGTHDYFITTIDNNMTKTSDGVTVNCKSTAKDFILDTNLFNIAVSFYANGEPMNETKHITAAMLGLLDDIEYGLGIVEEMTSNRNLSVGDTNTFKISKTPYGYKDDENIYKTITAESNNIDVIRITELDSDGFDATGFGTTIHRVSIEAVGAGDATITFRLIGLDDNAIATMTVEYTVTDN